MNQVKTGRLIRTMRTKLGLTQLALAEQLGVSDKAVSKWERGGGAPDISLLPLLSQALGVDTEALLRGDLEENDMTNGNMKKMRFYRCPACGNLLFSTDDADVTCCGAKLTNLVMHKPDEENALQIEHSDGEWYITAPHEMHREHYISFVAFLTGDTMIVKKQYPEWGLDGTARGTDCSIRTSEQRQGNLPFLFLQEAFCNPSFLVIFFVKSTCFFRRAMV